MPKMIDLESTGLRISYRLYNKHKQKYGLFPKFSFAVVGLCEVDLKIHIYLTRSNQLIK